jgi:hypothetical protein
MTDDPDRIPRMLEQMAAELRRLPACGDWVDGFVEHDAIGTDEAAFIANCSAQTIRRHAAEAAATDKPLGIWFAQSVWLISKTRLLVWIEEREGRPGRLAAESRARKYAQMRVPLQISNLMDAPQQAQG